MKYCLINNYNPLTIFFFQLCQVFLFFIAIAISTYTDVKAGTHGTILKDHVDPFI